MKAIMGASQKLGIIAGGGDAPRQLMSACRRIGREFFLVCLEGQAEPELPANEPHVWLPFGAGGKLKEILRKENISEVVMIGKVRRPSIHEIKPDLFTLKTIAKIGMNRLGDDGLLKAIEKVFAEEGVRVIGAQEIFHEFITTEGVLTETKPDKEDYEDIARGVEVAKALGSADVGQAVVVQQGLVLGVEAIEGTDLLIKRCASLKREGKGGVLVKTAKPQQDDRFDLPAIGIDTVAIAAESGLRGIAIEADRSLIIEKKDTLAKADDLGIFIVGIKLDKRTNGQQ